MVIATVAGILTIGTAVSATSAAAKPQHHTQHAPHAVKARPAPFLASRASTVHYAVNQPLCAAPKNPMGMRCFAMRRVTVAKGTPGAYAYTQPNAIGKGPAGGFTPDDIAVAYGFNPNLSRKSQLVAIIDWFDDPKALHDLNGFDRQYGLPDRDEQVVPQGQPERQGCAPAHAQQGVIR